MSQSSYYEAPPRRPGGPSGALVVVLSFLVALIAAAGLHLLTQALGDPKPEAAPVAVEPRVVPDVEGLTVASARDLARESGVLLHVMGPRPEGRVDNAKVVRQAPLPGSLVSAETPVQVFLEGAAAPGSGAAPAVASAPAAAPDAPVELPEAAVAPAARTFETPDVQGLELSGASRILAAAGLSLGEITEDPGSEAEAGTIISQRPEPTAAIAKGAAVDVTIAGAPQQVKIPRLVRMTKSAAVERLEALGLRVRTSALFSPGVPSGRVARTKPAAGETVEPGSSVLVILAE